MQSFKLFIENLQRSIQECNNSSLSEQSYLQGLAHRVQVPYKMQVFRKGHAAILGDIQKAWQDHKYFYNQREENDK